MINIAINRSSGRVNCEERSDGAELPLEEVESVEVPVEKEIECCLSHRISSFNLPRNLSYDFLPLSYPLESLLICFGVLPIII